jgi:RimJ/RimL family protein N-acetyltransferase
MLRGERVGLRARHETDVPVLDFELHDDVAMRSRADYRPWRPITPGSPASVYAVKDDPRPDVAAFSVVELATDESTMDELAGEALLWGIDAHNRNAHVGVSLRPAFRGKGLGADAVRVLCHYGFVVLGLHRLQVDTLADNTAMIRSAQQIGFTLEGTLRGGAWVTGEFLDEVILGMVATDWPSR